MFSGPLERGCQKVVNFPFCKDLGYNYTIITPQLQARAYKFIYRKNITDPDPETPRPGSILARVMSEMKSSPKCANSVQKLFCSEMVPPCFPDEGPKFYTVCKPICKNIGDDCPELLAGRGEFSFFKCNHIFHIDFSTLFRFPDWSIDLLIHRFIDSLIHPVAQFIWLILSPSFANFLNQVEIDSVISHCYNSNMILNISTCLTV